MYPSLPLFEVPHSECHNIFLPISLPFPPSVKSQPPAHNYHPPVFPYSNIHYDPLREFHILPALVQ